METFRQIGLLCSDKKGMPPPIVVTSYTKEEAEDDYDKYIYLSISDTAVLAQSNFDFSFCNADCSPDRTSQMHAYIYRIHDKLHVDKTPVFLWEDEPNDWRSMEGRPSYHAGETLHSNAYWQCFVS